MFSDFYFCLLPNPIPEMLLFLLVAQPNLENYIPSGFQMTAFGITLNPYQGLKRISWDVSRPRKVTRNYPESLSGIETPT